MKVTDDGHIECDECEGSGKNSESDFYCRSCNGAGEHLPHTTDVMQMLVKILKRLDDAGL
jgi:DnaJ-class molecular chaperone